MSTRVTDVRHGDDARPGQQEQTMVEAHAALDRIDNATCCVLLSFVPLDDGGFRIEVGVAGSGPSGFDVPRGRRPRRRGHGGAGAPVRGTGARVTDDERQRHIDVANQFHEAVLSSTPIGQVEGLAAAVSYRLGLVHGLEEMRDELRRCYAELRAEAQAMHVLLERCWLHRRALPASIANDLEQWKADQNQPPPDFSDEPTVDEKEAST